MKNQFPIYLADYTTRWVSYFDLLGTSELIKTKDWISISTCYEKAVENCTKDPGFKPKVEKMWFSDTFLFYSTDNTPSSFSTIEAASRWFVFFFILDGIPVRGAMTYGDIYANKENNIFFGPALIEAYH